MPSHSPRTLSKIPCRLTLPGRTHSSGHSKRLGSQRQGEKPVTVALRDTPLTHNWRFGSLRQIITPPNARLTNHARTASVRQTYTRHRLRQLHTLPSAQRSRCACMRPLSPIHPCLASLRLPCTPSSVIYFWYECVRYRRRCVQASTSERGCALPVSASVSHL